MKDQNEELEGELKELLKKFSSKTGAKVVMEKRQFEIEDLPKSKIDKSAEIRKTKLAIEALDVLKRMIQN